MGKAFPGMNQLKIRYRLVSYYYFRNRSPGRLDKLFYDTQPQDVVYMVDSGAFTFFETHMKLVKEEPSRWWYEMEAYVESYARFLDKYKSRIFACAEMDVDPALTEERIWGSSGTWSVALNNWWNTHKGHNFDGSMGYTPPPVAYWRDVIMQIGLPVIVGWHELRGWNGWLHQCQTYRFNALGSGEVPEHRQFPYMNIARKTGTLVHVFAGTKPEWLRRYPIYSSDSTTWLNGSKFGTTTIFQNGRMRFYEVKDKAIRKKYKWLYEKFGLNWKKIESSDAAEMDKASLLSWLQFATYLTTTPNKDYWTEEINGAAKDSLGPPSDLASVSELLGRHEGNTLEEVKENEKGPASKTPKAKIAKDETPIPAPSANGKFRKQSNFLPISAEPLPNLDPRLIQINEKGGSTENLPVARFRTQEFVSKEDAVLSPIPCNVCYMQDRCPAFEPDATCYYHLTNNFSDPKDFLIGLRSNILAQENRVTHALLQERLDGGQLDQKLSVEMDRLNEMIYRFKEFCTPREQEELQVKAKGKGAISAILEMMGPRKRQAVKQTPLSENA